MKFCGLCILILFVWMFSGCQQDSVEPKKIEGVSKVQREVFDIKKHTDLTAVGRINFMQRKQCTLTLVAEDIAITAGHCFLEEYHLSDMIKDLNPIFTTVIFRYDGFRRTEDLRIKKVLKAEMNPDFAIVRLNKKIENNLIKPLKFEKLTLEEMRSREQNLGCAGFNGDKQLGDGGFTMTISRNIKIIPEMNSENRIDTNCVSTHGGSGGAFFEERRNPKNGQSEFVLLGVIWGVIDDNFDLKGELIKETDSITSITPVSVFYDELKEIIDNK